MEVKRTKIWHRDKTNFLAFDLAKNEVLFLFAATTKAALRYISTYKYGQGVSRTLVQGGGGQAHLQVILKGLFHETLGVL